MAWQGGALRKPRNKKQYIAMDGDKEIIALLRSMGIAANQVIDEAAAEAGKFVLSEARRNAPVSEQGRIYGKWKHPPGTLRDSLILKKPRSNNATLKQRAFAGVTWAKNKYFSGADGFYARFVELGTKKMPARPFMRNAVDKNHGKISRIINGVIDKALRRVMLK